MKNQSLIKSIITYADLLLLVVIIFDLGFTANKEITIQKVVILLCITSFLFISNILRRHYETQKQSKKIALTNLIINGTVLFICAIVALVNISNTRYAIILAIRPVLEIGLVCYFIFRLLSLMRYVYAIYFNPAIVFAGSFIAIIIIGTFLLMIPSATTGSIRFIDALFTSTSAVCVTGLIVVDTSTDFTTTGQSIILALIQVGGLGILTFTSFFAFFFRGASSFKEGLNIKDFMSQETMGDVFKVALHVVIITVSVELIGAICIYFTVYSNDLLDNKIFFSIFHSISAFCNAGFSTLSNGLNEPVIKFNYGLQWVLIILITIGGIGHGVILNLMHYLKSRLNLSYFSSRFLPDYKVVTLNTKIVLTTSVMLVVAGFLLVLLFEWDHMLLEHKTWYGKLTATAFHAITPRTAGFNTSDFTLLTVPTLLILIFLMWIGGSPGSTAGGIKTSTLAVATLNLLAVARGKNRIQIFNRRISADSVSRAFAILSISLITIGFAIIGLLIFEPKGTNLMHVAFECFSAYSTVGLSLNVTPTLTDPSKIIIILIMFVGRIGMLNLLYGLLRELNHQFYEYPKENILIN